MFVAGCAQVPGRQAPGVDAQQRWQQRVAQVSAMDNWQLRGRVAIRTADEGFSGKLIWEQNTDDYRLLLVAPFGRGSFELSGDVEQVTLLAPKQAPVQAHQPEALLQSQLGWSIPVSGLRHWVLGVPDPGSPVAALQLDDAGRLSQLQQSGWQISIERYGHAGGIELPTKLRLNRESLSVRLVVQRWNNG